MSGADGVGSAVVLRCALVAWLGIACVQTLAGLWEMVMVLSRGGEHVSLRALVTGLGIACRGASVALALGIDHPVT
jgi:hypothetical protein